MQLVQTAMGLDMYKDFVRALQPAVQHEAAGVSLAKFIPPDVPSALESACVVKHGIVQRKAGLLRTWKDMHMVLTRDGFIHVFSMKEDLVPPDTQEMTEAGVNESKENVVRDASEVGGQRDSSAAPASSEGKAGAEGDTDHADHADCAPARATSDSCERHTSAAPQKGDASGTDGPLTTINVAYSELKYAATTEVLSYTNMDALTPLLSFCCCNRYAPQVDYFAFEVVETTKKLLVFSSSTRFVGEAASGLPQRCKQSLRWRCDSNISLVGSSDMCTAQRTRCSCRSGCCLS